MQNDLTFGQIIRERRSKMGLTQNELARRVGCASITIRKIEYDALRPSVQMAGLLALALNIPEEDQLGFVRLARKKERTTPIPTPSPMPGEIGMPDLSGRSVKEFQLGERIGSGGFGVVYRAQQPSVNRDVAIKIILPRFANNPSFIRRFEAEAQIVARLEHPHIVPLYDYWRESDAAYLIMRFLRGGSLEDKLASGPLSLANVYQTTQQIGLALDAAHRLGIIHRDIKPANVLLDEDMNAYLVDFGIAKNLEASESKNLTAGGAVIGSPAYISPEQILAEPVGPQSDIYCLGILLFETLTGQKPFPGPTPVAYIQQHLNEPLPPLSQFNTDLPLALDEIIQRATAKKSDERYQTTPDLLDDFEKVVATAVSTTGHHPVPISAVSPITTEEIEALENPYCGLQAFTQADAANFYGRDALIQEMLNLMSDESDLSRFTAVVGPSGSGKSSVVKAGLMPSLRRGGLPNSDNWFMVDLTPSSHPWEEIESALFRIAVNPPDSLLPMLQEGNRGLLRAVRRVLPEEDGAELLLLIDQFEELFTLVEDEAVRAHFLESLVTAVLDPNSRLRIVITLRADFTDRPLEYVDFGELMRQRTLFVLPMTPDELNLAVTEPSAQLGITMQPELIATIMRDVGEQPGMLPLLQYALTELFEQRQGRTLTLEAYRNTGGVTGALARRAEEIYDNLDAPAQEATRQLFLRLITLGEGVEDTRRRVLLTEIESLDFGMQNADFGGKHSAFRNPQSALERYGRFRLLTFDHDPTTRSATVEVAHEALLREWPRLRSWLTDSREDVRQQRLLAEAAAQWENATQESGYLLRGSRLTAFEAWAETTTIALTEDERGFLETSVATRDQRHAEEEARRQRELVTAQKLANEQSRRAEEQTLRAQEQAQAARTLRQRALFLTVASVVAVILAVVAFSFARSSTSNANLASTREAEAVANLELAATNEADAVANVNLASTREAEAEMERETALVAQQIALDEADSRATAETIAISEREIAQQQQVIAEQQLRLTSSRELALAANANLESNPERSLLLGLAALDNAYTTESEEAVRAALQNSRIELTLTQEGEDIWWIDYHPEGDWLVGVGEEGIVIWDTNSGDKVQTISLDIIDSGVSGGLDISPDGSLLAVTSKNQILVLDTTSWEIIHTLDSHTDVVDTIAFNQNSTLLASGSNDGELKIWDPILGEELLTLLAIPEGNFGGIVDDIVFSQDGSRVATASDDGTARIWDVATGTEITRMVHDALWINNIAFSADDTRLFTIPAAINEHDNELTIWDITTNPDGELTEPLAEWSNMHTNLISDLKLSPDGRLLATTSLDSTVKLWDATSDSAVEILTLLGHPRAVGDVAFSPDSSKIATLSGGEVRIWDISEAGLGEVLNIADSSTPFAFAPDNQSLITVSDDGIVKIWDVSTGNLLDEFDTLVRNKNNFSVAVSVDGRYLAIGGNDSVVNILDINSHQEVSTITGHGEGNVGGIFTGIIRLDFSPDGNLLATAGADGYAKVWEVTTGAQRYAWRVDPRNSVFWEGEGEVPNGVESVKFSPNGRFLAASTDEADGRGGIIKIWELESGTEMTVVEDSPRRLVALAFSPDSKSIASVGSSGIIRVWDVTTGERIANLEGETITINAVLFSADGSQLITGRRGIVIWDLESEEALVSLPQGFIPSALSPNGRYLAATGEQGIHIYTLDLDELVEIAQSRVTRGLTEAECKEYLHLEACPVD